MKGLLTSILFVLLHAVWSHEHHHHRGTCGTKSPKRAEGPRSLRELQDAVRRHLDINDFGDDRRMVKHKITGEIGHQIYHRKLGIVSAATVPVKIHAIRNLQCPTDSGAVYCDCTNQSLTEQASSSSSLTYVSQEKAQAEIDNLNVAYNSHGIVFTLSSYDVTCSPSWYANGCADGVNSQEEAMKTALGVTPEHYMNAYYPDCAAHGLFGFATFPPGVSGQNSDPNHWDQGVVNGWNTVSGGDFCGNIAPCQGDTMVHEAGHYFGLYHTFQGGCSEEGDGVADTPPVSQPNYGQCGNPSSRSDDPTEITEYCNDTSANPLNCNGCEAGNPVMQWNYMVRNRLFSYSHIP